MCKRRKVTERHHRQFVSNNVQEHSFTLQEERDNNVEQNQRWNRAFEINEKTPTTATKTKTLITFRWAISAVWKTAQPHWNSTLTRLKHHHSSSGSWSVSSWCFFLFFFTQTFNPFAPILFPFKKRWHCQNWLSPLPAFHSILRVMLFQLKIISDKFPPKLPCHIWYIWKLWHSKKKIVWVVWLHSANFTNVEGL